MLSLLDPIWAKLKLNRVTIDNNIFNLHYRLTVVLLVAFALVISSSKYFGDPIDCTSNIPAVEKIIDNFCWFNSYIIVPRDPAAGYPDVGGFGKFRPVIVDGVKNHDELENPNSEKLQKLKPYFLHAYQWIEFILFLQAVLFFLSRYLWRYCWEEGKIKAITSNFSVNSTKIQSDEKILTEIVEYIERNKGTNARYAYKFVFCEVLNFLNVLVQFRMIKSIFQLEWNVLLDDFFSSDSNVNPENAINMVFPNVARCDVPSPGSAGHYYSLELCVLPLNVFVTKVYIFLWFYLLGLLITSGLGILYRIATLSSRRLRWLQFQQAVHDVTKYKCDAIENLRYDDWFLLRLVSKNIDPFTFKSLIEKYNQAKSPSAFV